MKKEMPEEADFNEIEQVILDLYEKSNAIKITVVRPDYKIEVHKPIKEVLREEYQFNETYRYLKNAKRRIKTKTLEGYSDCKGNCRNALLSILQTLTGKVRVREATKELFNQGILGERESEFTETLEKLLVILHGLDSKKGSHPPMTKNVNDARLALDLTKGMVDYLVSQSTLLRD